MEINRLTLVRNRAQKLHKKLCLSMPVDLQQVLFSKNIVVRYKYNKYNIDGFCDMKKKPPEIEINTEITYEPRVRFTIAHEIGHVSIPWHTGIDSCSIDDPFIKIDGQRLINTQELEANTFASELLMPTDWIKSKLEENPTLIQLIDVVSRQAKTSIMACFYAFENALPSGHIYFVRSQNMDFWKSFTSKNTYTNKMSCTDYFYLFDKLCISKAIYQKSLYNIVHYKMLACPEEMIIYSLYRSCNSSMEGLLNAITDYHPIYAIHCLDIIIRSLQDNVYCILKLDDMIRHLYSDQTSIRLHAASYEFEDIFNYVYSNFSSSYELIMLDKDINSQLICIHEPQYLENKTDQKNPLEILKIITRDIDPFDDDQKLLKQINGVVGGINSVNKNAPRDVLYQKIKLRFDTDPQFVEFRHHALFETYLSNKIDGLLTSRSKRI